MKLRMVDTTCVSCPLLEINRFASQ